MSIPIIIDEWLFHDLQGEHGEDARFRAFNFINKILEICDKIVVLKGSPFEKKFNALCKNLGPSVTLGAMFQFFKKGLWTNSLKTIFIEQNKIKPLPNDLNKLIPEDDRYLFQLNLLLKDSIIVTHEEKLYEIVKGKKLVNLSLRDVFLESYFKKKRV